MSHNLKKEQIKGFTIWTVILIVVAVIVVGIVALSYIFSGKSQQESLPTTPTEETIPEATDKEDGFTRFDYEPGTTTILHGTIKEIASPVLTIKAREGEPNPALAGKSFEVTIDNKTKIILLKGGFSEIQKDGKTEVIPRVDSSQDDTKGEEEQVLSITDLEIGYPVIVLSRQDIKDQDSFVAKEIYYIDYINK